MRRSSGRTAGDGLYLAPAEVEKTHSGAPGVRRPLPRLVRIDAESSRRLCSIFEKRRRENAVMRKDSTPQVETARFPTATSTTSRAHQRFWWVSVDGVDLAGALPALPLGSVPGPGRRRHAPLIRPHRLTSGLTGGFTGAPSLRHRSPFVTPEPRRARGPGVSDPSRAGRPTRTLGGTRHTGGTEEPAGPLNPHNPHNREAQHTQDVRKAAPRRGTTA